MLGLFLSSRTVDVQMLDRRWGGAESMLLGEFEESMLDLHFEELKTVDQQLPQGS